MFDRYIHDVTSLKLNSQKCILCKMCINVCPHDVLSIGDRTAFIKDKDACMECGACARNCPTEAITVSTGMGCASGLLQGIIKGKEPSCGCCENNESGQTDCC